MTATIHPWLRFLPATVRPRLVDLASAPARTRDTIARDRRGLGPSGL